MVYLLNVISSFLLIHDREFYCLDAHFPRVRIQALLHECPLPYAGITP